MGPTKMNVTAAYKGIPFLISFLIAGTIPHSQMEK